MKINFLKYILILCIVAFYSCDNFDETVFDGTNTNNQTLVGFSQAQYNLAVAIDAEGQVEVTVNVSTLSENDRTYQLNLVDLEGDNLAFPETFQVPNQVTVPAGEFQGTFTILGFDNNLVEPQPRTFEIELSGSNESDVFSIKNATVSVFEVCPVPNDFLVGQYQIEDVDAAIGPGNDTENFASGVVDIQIGNQPTDRVFTVGILPAFAGDRNVTLSMVCNEFVLRNVDPALTCDGESDYIFTSASNGNNANTTYDIDNELNEYTIFYTEDPNGSCGGPFLSSFKLTKIN